MIQLIVLAIAAFLTSVISGIIGMGGGILLLATMLTFLSHAETIPAHGAVQLVSNSTRFLAFIHHVNWKACRQFAFGAVPGCLIGGVLLWWLRRDNIATTEPYFKIAIGLYVLAMTITPLKKASPPGSSRFASLTSSFFLFGGLAGTLGLTIGAVGPLIAPLFLRQDFSKEQIVATKSVCQAVIHFLKIPIFLASGLVAYKKLGLLIIVMAVMVIPGTLLGRKIHTVVNEATFIKLFKLAMLLAGLKVLGYDGIYKMLPGTS